MVNQEIFSTILGLAGIAATLVLCGWLKRKLRKILTLRGKKFAIRPGT